MIVVLDRIAGRGAIKDGRHAVLPARCAGVVALRVFGLAVCFGLNACATDGRAVSARSRSRRNAKGTGRPPRTPWGHASGTCEAPGETEKAGFEPAMYEYNNVASYRL